MFVAGEKKYFIQALLTGVVLVVMVAGALVISQNDSVVGVVERFGYFGIFGLSILSGFNFIVPVPIVALTPIFLEAGLVLWLTVLVTTLGMTLGDSVGYMFGSVGRKLVTPSRAHDKVVKWANQFKGRHRLLPYFVLLCYAALAPAPNEVIVIPLSFAGYKPKYILPIVFVGNLIFNIFAVFGINLLANLF